MTGGATGDAPALLGALQRRLQSIYEVEVPHAVQDFVLTDAEAARRLEPEPFPRETAEKLLVRECGESLDLTLYLDAELLARLEADNPSEHLHAGNFADFCIALEGVSHFIYLVWNALHGRGVSLFELELQAEVDKYAAAAFQFGHQHGGNIPPWLHTRLFARPAFDASLDASGHRRYRAANDYAARFCGGLARRHLKERRNGHLVNDLRRFYRLTQRQKLRGIETVH